MKLSTYIVEKPWGRTDIPAAFNVAMDGKIGEIWYDIPDGPQLPVLVKWLFTSEKLSVQVHPNDDQARSRGQVSGKEECWYIVDAKPGATIGIGTKLPMTGDELRAAALSGDIEHMLDWKPVAPGQFYYIPAGTVHAIGAGVTLVEVQQNADITYRLYDYGRPRVLHLDDGIAVSCARPYDDPRSGQSKNGEQLVDGPHFRLWRVDDMAMLTTISNAHARWVIPLSGILRSGDDVAGVGDCLYVPAYADIMMDDDARCLLAMI